MAGTRHFWTIPSKKVPAKDKSFRAKMNRLSLRLSPPNHRHRLSPEDQGTEATEATERRGAEVSSNHPESGEGDVSFGQKLRNVVPSPCFIRRGRPTSQDASITEHDPVPEQTLPPQRTLKGAKVSIVDTSAAVPGSIDLMRHDPRSFRGELQRHGAIKRKNRKQQAGGSYETGRKGERVFFESSRDEARWQGNRRSLRNSIRSIRSPRTTGLELLPLHQDSALVLPPHLTAQPSSSRTSRERKSDHQGKGSVGDTGPNTAVRCPTLETNDDQESDLTVSAGSINEDDLTLTALLQLQHERCRALAGDTTQEVDISHITARSGRSQQRTCPTLSRTPRSCSGVIDTASPSEVDEDEQRANRLTRQQARVDQRATAAWWRSPRGSVRSSRS